MTLRTPRRRISPRTIRRYRAIKNFTCVIPPSLPQRKHARNYESIHQHTYHHQHVFRPKTEHHQGASSQPDIKNNSSVCVSILDLREKIHGIEQQLNIVGSHCQDLACLGSRLKLKDNVDSEKETAVAYITSENRCEKPGNCKSTPNVIVYDDEDRNNITGQRKMLDQNKFKKSEKNRCRKLYDRLDPVQEGEHVLRSHQNYKASRTLPNSFHRNYSQSITVPRNYNRHLDASYSEVHRKNVEYLETNNGFDKLKKEQRCGDYKNKSHRNKYLSPDLGQDYITEIISRQYRPVKLFGRRESELSQFSAPVCRDQEFPIRETVQKGSDLCSCCHEDHKHRKYTKYICNNDLSGVRSICDTRLYSSKKHKHHTNCRKRADDFYNDTAMYDVIPVKEKASPKSRRKFVEDNMLTRDNYREVLPSPRTHRPQLNLQTQYQAEDDVDEIMTEKKLKRLRRLQRKTLIQNEGNVSKMSSEVFIHNRHFKGIQYPQQIPCNTKPNHEECIGTASSLQYQSLPQDPTKVNTATSLNTQIDASGDKTDKALNEIKDILQIFLQEIKKESLQNKKITSLSASTAMQNMPETQNQMNNSSFNTCLGHCSMPLMQSFPNSCCYPIVPVCPMNLQMSSLQNGYVVPSPSFTCPACVNNSKEQACGCNDFKSKSNSTENPSSETKKLLKEIHNLISQQPNSISKNELGKNHSQAAHNNDTKTKILTSRSVGGSSRASELDAKVGTSKMKSYSKSCEAIDSRETMDTRHAANTSYSDTVLEKGSGEETVTDTVSESQYLNINSAVVDKVKENKFKKMLRSIGILKRKKRDIIEEFSEKENNVELQGPPQNSLFPQHIINYNMHGQEYFNPPPINPYNQHQYEYYGQMPRCDPNSCHSPMYRGHAVQDRGTKSPCLSPHHIGVSPCGSYYDPRYLNISPQVPVCLKEIEVKSIGTQSVRKMSLFQKLTKKMQVPVQQTRTPSPKQSSTRTTPKEKTTNNLFDWKKIHEKAMQKTADPLKISYKTQKRLAKGDNTMRNVMLKKIFYKRNPFSSQKLLVRTLLGKDRSSFGDPPKMYKPKMFL